MSRTDQPRRHLAAGLLALVGLAACGSGTAGSGNGGKTVDTSSCSYGPNSAGPYSPNPPGTNGVGDHAQAMPEMPHEHVNEGFKVTYAHNPPTSGCHYSVEGKAPVPPGAYPNQPVIPAEYWVHNLEHGYTVVLYRCPQGCDADLQALRHWLSGQKPDPGLVQVAHSNPHFKPYPKVVVVPWPTMDHRFAALFWDYYDPMDTLDLTELQHFYDNHVGHGPEIAAGGGVPL